MSSIMRCRSGLMASSVMGDAPVLMKVANPSSQDRTPHRAIPLAVLPAAGPYRASGLVQWREAVVRGRMDLGCPLLGLERKSDFEPGKSVEDPERTFWRVREPLI